MKVIRLSSITLAIISVLATSTYAVTFNAIGTNNTSLQHGVGGLFDITDPNNDNTVDISVWGAGVNALSNPNTDGNFNGPGNNGEKWSKVFDNHVGPGNAGSWGSSTSKVCCSFSGGGNTFVQIDSTAYDYNVEAYTLSSANDVVNRDPTSWRLQGSNDGVSFTTIDTVTSGDINGGSGFTSRRQVNRGDLASPADSYSSYRLVIDSTTSGFQLMELELLSSRAEVGFDNNTATATVNDQELFGGTLVFEFDGSSFDQLTGPGTFDLNGATIELEELTAADPGTYQLLDAASIIGTLGSVIAPDNFDTSQLAIDGTVTVNNTVPEPATIAIWSMIGIGLFGFGYRRMRKNNK